MGLSAPVPMERGWTMAPVCLCPLRHPLQMPLGLEPVPCSASMVVAVSSMLGGSPSAAASPVTRAISVNWTSAGNTVKTEAPVQPPHLACPPAAVPPASQAPGAPSRCVQATALTTAPAPSTRVTSPSADVYLASWVTVASTGSAQASVRTLARVRWPPMAPDNVDALSTLRERGVR